MRRRAYPFGRYLVKNKTVSEMGTELRGFVEEFGFSVTKHDEMNEDKGTLIIAVNKKVSDLIKEEFAPSRLRALLKGTSLPSHRQLDPEFQRVGIELYVWPFEDGILMEMFILPYMEHLNRPEVLGITESEKEEITDWFLCEQVWEQVEPKLVEKFGAEPLHTRV